MQRNIADFLRTASDCIGARSRYKKQTEKQTGAPTRMTPVAILVGLALEVLKYINLLTWPFLKLKLPKEHGPFYSSVTIVLWSFVAAQMLLMPILYMVLIVAAFFLLSRFSGGG